MIGILLILLISIFSIRLLYIGVRDIIKGINEIKEINEIAKNNNK